MDLRDSPEEAAFRKEVIEFIETEAPEIERGDEHRGVDGNQRARTGSSRWPTAAGSLLPGPRNTAAPA